jgi:hypothetical protein
MKYWYDHLDHERSKEANYITEGLAYIEDEYLWCYTTTGELSHRGRRVKNECLAAQLG